MQPAPNKRFRYLVEKLIAFPHDGKSCPHVFDVTAIAAVRHYIHEFPRAPLLCMGLCLDSGTNSSCILNAIADIISGFEKSDTGAEAAAAGRTRTR